MHCPTARLSVLACGLLLAEGIIDPTCVMLLSAGHHHQLLRQLLPVACTSRCGKGADRTTATDKVGGTHVG